MSKREAYWVHDDKGGYWQIPVEGEAYNFRTPPGFVMHPAGEAVTDSDILWDMRLLDTHLKDSDSAIPVLVQGVRRVLRRVMRPVEAQGSGDMTECGHSKYVPCHNCEPLDAPPSEPVGVPAGVVREYLDAHATAAKDAEIEALRADVEAWKASHTMLTDTCHHFQSRAKRQAEALQAVVDALGHPLPVMSAGYVYLPERVIRPALDAARAALRDHDQESGAAFREESAAVNEAMVERALQAWFETDDWVALLSGIEPAASSRSRMRAALTAALAAQPGGRSDDQ